MRRSHFVGPAALLLRLRHSSATPNSSQPFSPGFPFPTRSITPLRLESPDQSTSPAMWTHFESLRITMQPTYKCRCTFPLRASSWRQERCWWGNLAPNMFVRFCADVRFHLLDVAEAWLPPILEEILLGGFLAVLRLGLSLVIGSTYGDRCRLGRAALGGALVLGAFPRMMRGARSRDSLLLGVGVVLLATSRPFEGALLCLTSGRSGMVDIPREKQATGDRAASLRDSAFGRDHLCRVMDGLLRLPRQWKPDHTPLHIGSGYARGRPLLGLAITAPRATL